MVRSSWFLFNDLLKSNLPKNSNSARSIACKTFFDVLLRTIIICPNTMCFVNKVCFFFHTNLDVWSNNYNIFYLKATILWSKSPELLSNISEFRFETCSFNQTLIICGPKAIMFGPTLWVLAQKLWCLIQDYYLWSKTFDFW